MLVRNPWERRRTNIPLGPSAGELRCAAASEAGSVACADRTHGTSGTRARSRRADESPELHECLVVHVRRGAGAGQHGTRDSPRLPVPRMRARVHSGAKTRVSTRATLVSTSGARRSYANDATAPAVYAPMPGSSCSASRLAWNRGRAYPPERSRAPGAGDCARARSIRGRSRPRARARAVSRRPPRASGTGREIRRIW